MTAPSWLSSFNFEILLYPLSNSSFPYFQQDSTYPENQIKSENFPRNTTHLIRRLPLLPRRQHGRRVGEPPHGRRSRQLGLEDILNQINLIQLSKYSRGFDLPQGLGSASFGLGCFCCFFFPSDSGDHILWEEQEGEM